MLETNAMRRISGGTLDLLMIMLRDIRGFGVDDSVLMAALDVLVAVLDTELVSLLVGREISKMPRPSELRITASASANARECSKIVMPVSACGLCPCKLQDTVSRKWLTQSERNSGQSTLDEPTTSLVCDDGTIPALIHDCSSVCQKSSAELRRKSRPPSPMKAPFNILFLSVTPLSARNVPV